MIENEALIERIKQKNNFTFKEIYESSCRIGREMAIVEIKQNLAPY